MPGTGTGGAAHVVSLKYWWLANLAPLQLHQALEDAQQACLSPHQTLETAATTCPAGMNHYFRNSYYPLPAATLHGSKIILRSKDAQGQPGPCMREDEKERWRRTSDVLPTCAWRCPARTCSFVPPCTDLWAFSDVRRHARRSMKRLATNAWRAGGVARHFREPAQLLP